ncbi:MAG TPA: hypothetical protein PK360_21290 [bacterium]|nr:hypothetical protein [bacterium]
MTTKSKALYYGCAGCAVVLFLFVALVGGGIGYITYQGYQFGKEIGSTYQNLVTDYQQLDQKYAFTPPPEGILDKNRLDAFLNVRAQLAEFAKTYQDNIGKIGDSIGQQFDKPGIISKIRGISKIRELVDVAAKIGAGIGQEHIRLLNDQAMSIQEYRWYTQICLGTLSKSKENQFEPGVKCWDEYLKKFDTARAQFKDMHINMGDQGFHGGEMNQAHLLDKLTAVPYLPQNAEILQPALERFLPADSVTVLDFLTLHYDEIFEHFAKGK